ncbi:tetratricopeptide repeat protein [Opitutus sp. ER46]|uniref:tetratricopeptide repeat protein n=1 Tax=Opitutus sp. ER46 TaxID=2161864 RepID=UPI000D2FCC52|nr:tetratricopeptide repeat protein [Opitutus sp. ER46]PTX91233.1 hypothetical protein DB354_21625 [Opitutus sp. ER46]
MPNRQIQDLLGGLPTVARPEALAAVPVAGKSATAQPERPRQLDVSFEWGRSEELLDCGALADPLDRLKAAAQPVTAKLTAATRFDVARDAVKQQRYAQAFQQVQGILQPVDAGVESGEADFRPFFLAGVLRLGSFFNRDPELVDLAKAEDAFMQAARRATRENTFEAALAWLAAGWSCYAAGRFEAAQVHTRAALALQPTMAEGHFQMAKILCHLERIDEARPVVERAIEIDPAYAMKASADGDFTAYQEVLVECTESVKLHARRRAKTALQRVADQNAALGLDRESPDLEESVANAIAQSAALAELANQTFADDTVHGYRRAEANADEAAGLIAALISRFQKSRLTAADMIDSTRRECERVQQLQVGGYRLVDFASSEIATATSLLNEAQANCAKQSLNAFALAESQAARARATLNAAMDRFRVRALARVSAESADVARTLAQPARSRPRGDEIKTCSLVAVLIGVCPSGCIVGAGTGTSLTGAAVVEFIVWVVALALAGALVGAFASPLCEPESSAHRQQLKLRQRALEESLAQLRAFSH